MERKLLKNPKRNPKTFLLGNEVGVPPPPHTPTCPQAPRELKGGEEEQRGGKIRKKSYRIVYSFIGFGCICTCGAEAGPSWRQVERCLWRNSHQPGLGAGEFSPNHLQEREQRPDAQVSVQKNTSHVQIHEIQSAFFFFFLFKKRTEDPLEKSGTPGWTLARVCCSVSLASCPHERVQAGRPSRSQHT